MTARKPKHTTEPAPVRVVVEPATEDDPAAVERVVAALREVRKRRGGR